MIRAYGEYEHPLTPEQKRNALIFKMIKACKLLGNSDIINPYHLDEIAETVQKLDHLIKMAVSQL